MLIVSLCRHTRNNEIPIVIYRVVHTGAKTQFGGLNDGLLIAAYHVGIFLLVNIDPIIPAVMQITMHMINRNQSPFCINKFVFCKYWEISEGIQ